MRSGIADAARAVAPLRGAGGAGGAASAVAAGTTTSTGSVAVTTVAEARAESGGGAVGESDGLEPELVAPAPSASNGSKIRLAAASHGVVGPKNP